jgi:heme/copper-type cytochrome/quinol oxidase subunit 2
MGIAFLFLLGIATVMIVYAIRYSSKRLQKALQINFKLSVEIIWIIFPILLLGLMYYYGYKNFI